MAVGKTINIILIVLLFIILAFSSYMLYENYPRASEVLNIISKKPDLELMNLSSSLIQFEKNMRFNHNILTYFISECSYEKRARLLGAFSIVENETKIITFIEVYNETEADILVGCSKDSFEREKNVFVAGEGGPTRFLNLSLYPVIIKGKIVLYEEDSCSYPITELHELFHVFGFDHINDRTKIMYPYIDCKQRIDPELVSSLINLYSIIPKAEIILSNASAIKSGRYLNFSLTLANEGLISANKILLEVYGDEEKIDSFSLEDIDLGESQTFSVKNLRLNSLNTKELKFIVLTKTEEFNKENNILEMSSLS